MKDYIQHYNNYNDYLKGAVWTHNKAYLRTFESYHSCHICGAKGEIHLHHSNYQYASIPLEYPPSFLFPLCPKHHAVATELALSMGHRKATEELCRKFNAPMLPVEHAKYLDTLIKATQFFAKRGTPYLQVKRSPFFIVQDKSALCGVWVTNQINAHEVNTMLKCPLPLTFKVLERVKDGWKSYTVNSDGTWQERKTHDDN